MFNVLLFLFFCDFFLSPKEKTGVAINIEQQPLTG